ncbi:MAG: hypothetical protein U0R17_04995 [Acidimicrobiia bacterium]
MERRQSNKPHGQYFSRKGEGPSDIGLLTPADGDHVVVLVRYTDGKRDVVDLLLDDALDFGNFKHFNKFEFPIAGNSAPREIVEMMGHVMELTLVSPIYDLTKEPKWAAASPKGKPVVRLGRWNVQVNDPAEFTPAFISLLNSLSEEVAQGSFTRYGFQEHGGVMALPLIVVEVPNFREDVIPAITSRLESVDGSQGRTIVLDTRSFDREHLIEMYAQVFSEDEVAKLAKNKNLTKLIEEYGGSAEFATRIYKTASRNLGADGKSVKSFDEIFGEVEPQFGHVADVVKATRGSAAPDIADR